MGTNQINNWGLLTGLASDVNSGTLVTCPYLRRCFPTGTEHHRLKRYDSTKFAKLMTREIRGLSFTFTNFSAGNISKPTFRSVSRWIQDLEETGIPPPVLYKGFGPLLRDPSAKNRRPISWG